MDTAADMRWYNSPPRARERIDQLSTELLALDPDQDETQHIYSIRLARRRLAELDPARLTVEERRAEIDQLQRETEHTFSRGEERANPGAIAHRDRLHRLWHRLRGQLQVAERTDDATHAG